MNAAEGTPSLRMVGPWPPSKGVSLYCYHLATAVSRLTPVQFSPLSKLYPTSLYPGRTTEMPHFAAHIPKDSKLRITGSISYRRPPSWLTPALEPNAILHLHWWTPYRSIIYAPMLSLARRRGSASILTLHNVLPHESRRVDMLASRVIMEMTSRFIVHSRMNKAEAMAVFGLEEERIHIVPHGPLTVLLRRKVPRRQARRALNIPPEKRVLLFFGNIREYKGLRTLVEATRIAKRQVDDLLLIVAGEVWKHLEYLLRIPPDLKSDVRLYPWFIPTEKTTYFFQAADLVVLPYERFHGQSGVASAAHAFGKPLLVTQVGGLPEMVRDSIAVAKPNDPNDLARRISAIMTDPSVLNKLGKDSRLRARDFSWDKIARMTMEVYASAQ
ncbi:MAG: glycosyltransferase family 4 protein [Thermoplasmata archaeon]